MKKTTEIALKKLLAYILIMLVGATIAGMSINNWTIIKKIPIYIIILISLFHADKMITDPITTKTKQKKKKEDKNIKITSDTITWTFGYQNKKDKTKEELVKFTYKYDDLIQGWKGSKTLELFFLITTLITGIITILNPTITCFIIAITQIIASMMFFLRKLTIELFLIQYMKEEEV